MNKLIKTSTGELIPFYSANLSIDKASFVWSFSADIADASYLDKLKPVKSLRGDYIEISFKLGLTTWELIAELPSYNNTSNSFSISARSKTVFLTDEYSNPLTKTWTNTTAHSIVNELCANVDIALNWLINDWHIDSYMVTDRAPKDIIVELAGEKKAILQTLPNSTLVIMPNLPCSPKKLQDYAADYIIATDKNLFTRNHQFKNQKNYNRVAVTKQTDTTQNAPSISIEEQPQGNDRLIKVIVNPPVNSVELTHTSGSNVDVFYEGIQQAIINDQLIISNGKAQLSKPFAELINVNWHQNVLGELNINAKGEISTANGFGLITISYQSPYHQYRFQKKPDIESTAIEIADILPQAQINALYAEYVIDSGDRTMPSIVVNTLSTPADLIERAQQELWEQLADMDEYSIECAYENEPILLASVATVKINKEGLEFNGYVKSVLVQIGATITQNVKIERPLL